GWLSSNCILFQGPHGGTLIDSGYHSHAQQTLALVCQQLAGRALQTLINTHLHSDHCGGNALLQQQWPSMQTLVPAGALHAVRRWDEDALSFRVTGQTCQRFTAHGTLRHGDTLALGGAHWQVHAAAGHDPDMLILFEPLSRTLISADALWENGFGVIFPEIEGQQAFAIMAQTLDLIEHLRPAYVIPGHGKPFHDAPAALAIARRRLDGFVRNPQRHAQHAAKVLLKFKLLEWQRIARDDLHAWAHQVPYLQRLRLLTGAPEQQPLSQWLDALLQELVHSQAAHIDAQGWIHN
ncbi:MAG: MBL fold metallo-hydrolase, partial [Comamonadaceae bacterium]|nr:MBL fold metallo-hydrolase [Comamonadaceae bacterium]